MAFYLNSKRIVLLTLMLWLAVTIDGNHHQSGNALRARHAAPDANLVSTSPSSASTSPQALISESAAVTETKSSATALPSTPAIETTTTSDDAASTTPNYISSTSADISLSPTVNPNDTGSSNATALHEKECKQECDNTMVVIILVVIGVLIIILLVGVSSCDGKEKEKQPSDSVAAEEKNVQKEVESKQGSDTSLPKDSTSINLESLVSASPASPRLQKSTKA